nr:uncharacterized protein LOC116425492 [Nomia melanderi]
MEVFTEITTPSFYQRGSSSGQQTKDEEKGEEGDCDVEHLCCRENEEQGVCLITSSSEIQGDPGIRKATGVKKNGLKKIDELIKRKDDRSVVENTISKSADGEKPIFVDLTTDEKIIRKQTIPKRFCDVKPLVEINEEEKGIDNRSTSVVIEPRIMIADSSSKSQNARTGSLATALRDRGPYLIPVQPNRSLPILPAPLPSRSFRKNGPSLVFLSKSANLDVVELESGEPIANKTIHNRNNVNEDTVESSLRTSLCTKDYVAPRITNVASFGGTKRKINDDGDQGKAGSKENKRKKKSQGTNSNQAKEDGLKSSVKKFIKTFGSSTDSNETRNRCGDKCTKAVSTTRKESCGKVVPPLRLKKIIRMETERYNNSQITTRTKHESNYKVIRDKTSHSRSNPNSTTFCISSLHEKEANLNSLKNDNYKVKYRRNRLKQKLRELRGKASDLAKQMANDTSSQQNTRLRQIMNRYQKQIENLSKLHSKLSATLSTPEKGVNVNANSDLGCPSEVEYLSAGLNETDNVSMKNVSLVPSPEPPKLSPRSSVSYEDIPPEEIRDSPPLLPRVCLNLLSGQDEEFQVSESKIWPMNDVSTDPVRNSSLAKTSISLEESRQTTNNSLNVLVDDFNVDKRYLNFSNNVVQLLDNNHLEEKKEKEKHEMEEELSPGRLVIHEEEKINNIKFPDSGPIISSVISGQEAAANVSGDKVFDSTSGKQVLKSDSYEYSQKEPFTKVTSSSSQSIQIQFMKEVPSRQESITVQQHYKAEKPAIDAAQENTSSYTITEQFPTLGNWVARMSKKQSSKSKSKLQNMGTVSVNGTTENRIQERVPETERQKIIAPNASNDIMDTKLEYSPEGWQFYHHQQQRQQQLLQHVASVTLPQPVPMVPPFRPGIYPPIPTNQYYRNNYAIDSYNSAAFNYPTICPYSPYSYHSRLHPAALSGYHFPMQEGLRPLQHVDKCFLPPEESVMKYSSPIMNNLQHSTALPPDRLRGSISGSNVGVASLPSLFLPPSSLSSSQQALSRLPLPGYSKKNQFSRNRMIPNVVAAAAAAAVVAAASLDRQRDPLPCNNDESNTAIPNIMDPETPNVASSSKSDIPRSTSQSRDSGFSGNVHKNSTKYRQMQNFLFDQLGLISTSNNFIQSNTTSDSQLQMATAVPSPQHKLLVPQITKSNPENEVRNCDTPHLGKLSHSPNSLHNLTCSNCGLIAPKFKCLGCELVFYCDVRCQEKHWNLHVQWCPKKMPKLKKVT